MSHTPISAIMAVLDSYRLGQAHQRSSLATLVAKTKRPFTDAVVELLLAHFGKNGGGDPPGCICLAITDGSWVQLVDDLRRQRTESIDEAAEARAKADSSRIESVGPTNPYGWDQSETKRGEDHNVPGAWNPFRQSYNLTAAERMEFGATDNRRRGCSRWEVLNGKKGSNAESKVLYDPLEVARAQGKDYGEPTAQPERRVYGE